MTDIRMADVSEFQDEVDAPAYLGAGYKCIICRTYNGSRADYKMPDRRDYLRSHDFTGVGWYCYLKQDVDPTVQAQGFISTIGELKENEWAICDVEEGYGSQTARAEEWFSVVDKWAGFPSMLYASDYFIQGQLSGYAHWTRPIWVAGYGAGEPSGKHVLWQYTDRENMQGVSGPCDANLAHQSASDFVATVRAGQTPPAPSPLPLEEADMITALLKKDGRIEVFVEKNGDGSVWHIYQKAENGGWAGSGNGKNATWYALGTPPGKN